MRKNKKIRILSGVLATALAMPVSSFPVKAEEVSGKNLTNIALEADAKTEDYFSNGTYPISNINDGNQKTGVLSKDLVDSSQENYSLEEEQYITLNWDKQQTFDTVVLCGLAAKDQMLTSWDIEILKAGEENWQKIGETITKTDWESSSDQVIEQASTKIERQTEVVELRIKVDAANLKWKHYFVTELEVYDSEENQNPKVTYQVNAENCDGVGSYEAGKKVTITAPYNGEDAFVEWKVEGLEEKDGVNFSQNPLVFEMPEENVTLTPVYKKQTIVSKVEKTEGGKGYLEVDGKPWLYHFIQNMGTWERMGHQAQFESPLDLSFSENMYEKTAHLNYETISQALLWRDIEIEPGVYDFTIIDSYIEWAKKYGMKIDLAWFGSACQGGSRIPGYSNVTNGKGEKLDIGYQYTPPAWFANDTYYQVWKGNGQVDYPLIVTGKNAEYMKQRECYALQALFNHLAEVDPEHTVISIQIENEANGVRDYKNYKNWINELGRTIKESAYVVATRVNFSGWGYPLAANDYAYIDFAGADPYTTSVGNIRSILKNGEASSPLTYIAENGGNYNNLTSLVTAAFLEGGFYGTWSLNNWFCDGSGGHLGGPFAVYANADNTEMYYDWELGKIPSMTVQATDVMHYNVGLNKMGTLVAQSEKKNMVGFNVETDKPKESYNKIQKLNGYQIGYTADDASVGMAIADGQELYVTSDTSNAVTIKTKQKPIAVSSGKMDEDENWISDTSKDIQKDADGNYCFTLNSEECVQIQMPESTELSNLALKATAESSSVNKDYPASNVNDGDEWSGTKSTSNPSFPQYITLKWEEKQNFDTVDLMGIYAKDQNPKSWEIEVSKDGENNWTKVAESGKVQWDTSDSSTENKSVVIPRQTEVKGLRVKILDANLTWGAYYVTEIQVFDSLQYAQKTDKTKLQSFYDENKNKKQQDYTEESWNVFTTALEKAKSVLDNETATQEEADEAEENLKKAVDALMIKTGWQTIDGRKYYYGEDGSMKTYWQQIDGKWYFFGNDGVMRTYWQKIWGKWYYLGNASDGAMKTGWQKIWGKWYYLGNAEDGSMKTYWQKINGKWYFFGSTDDGAMKTGWQKIWGKWYYLGSANDGAMKTNKWVGDYYVDDSGVWSKTRKSK